MRQAEGMDARGWWSAAGDLLLGGACPGCRAPGSGVCAPCRSVVDSASIARELREVPGWPPVWSAGVYDDRLRELVATHKERGARVATGVLGDALARAVAGLLLDVGPPAGQIVLTPVPSTDQTLRTRGYDSVLLLTRHAARRLSGLGLAVRVERLLHHARRVGDQSRLSTGERWANLQGALSAVGSSGPVVVVDDLVTTGATMAEACRAVGSTGTEVLGGAAVAAPRLRQAVRAAVGPPAGSRASTEDLTQFGVAGPRGAAAY